MTLNDLWARFKVTNFLNAAKDTKYSWVMTPTPCTVAGCIISIRPMYSCAGALTTYLLTYLHSWLWAYKTGNISETAEDRANVLGLLLTAYIKSFIGFRLPRKCMTLNNLWARFKVTDSLNAAKMAKYSLLMTPTPCRVAGCITWPLLGLRIHAPVHSLTQLARRI